MAIDSKSKRFSMLNFGSISTDLLPNPDGTIDQGDRQHLLDLYSGVLAGVALADVIVALQIDDGGGFVDIDGTKRSINLSSGYGSVSFGVITDVSAGDKLRVRWERVGGATAYTIYPNQVALNIRYLAALP